MKPANADEFAIRQKYRQHISDIDLPTENLDELIDIIHSILSYFVDHAFGVQTDQITLQFGKTNFTASHGRATIEHHPDHQSDAAEGDSSPIGQTEP